MTLNEIEGMKVVMPQIDHDWINQIIIVDVSTDGTIEWACDNGYDVYIQKKKGFRHAYEEVWPLIRGEMVVITFSPDGNSIADLIPNLTAEMAKGYDMVIVSRYLDGAKSEDDDIVTGFGNWLFTKTVNILHGGNYTDVMVIYRAYRKSLATDLDLIGDSAFALPEKLFSTKISWEPLLSVRATKANLKLARSPVMNHKGLVVERKLKIIRWGAAYYFQFIRELWFWKPHAPSDK